MSSQKTSNNDSCRDLSGRRLSTIKEAKKLAEYLENEPARKKAAAEASKAKLEALEKRLGISAPSTSGEASSSSTARTGGEVEPVAGKKHRFEDSEYLEQSREIVDSVKSAVYAGLLKKKKKAKLAHAAAATSTTDAVPADGLAAVVAAVVESPATAPIVAAAAVAAGVAAS